MKKYVKRNQILITALAIMIAVAGYLSFQDQSKQDSVDIVSSDTADGYFLDLSEEELAMEGNGADQNLGMDLSEEDINVEKESGMEQLTEGTLDSLEENGEVLAAANFLDSSMDENEADILEPGDAIFTSGTATSALSSAKLMKEQTRAKNKETLLDIINNTSISEEAKTDAIQEMIQSTAIAEKEMGAEILLEAKGFQGAVVSITEDSADVCVISQDLTDPQRAQIEDIVSRKAAIPKEKIVITSVW